MREFVGVAVEGADAAAGVVCPQAGASATARIGHLT